MASRAYLSNFFEEQLTQNYPPYLSGLLRALFLTTFLKIPVYARLSRLDWLYNTTGNPRHSWILDSTQWIPDSSYWIPVFVSGTLILDSNRWWDYGLFEMYSGFQSRGFRIPLANFSRILESGFPYMRRNSVSSRPFEGRQLHSQANCLSRPRNKINITKVN